MAGKTFTGIGLEDLEKEPPPLGRNDTAPDGEEVRGVYSGPTVVDDDKVAEGLKRLRSLEKQPAPTADDEPELVADMDSSEPTKIGLPTMRPTAVGRSLASESPGQQMVVHPESMRGTMFGHSVHLPDLPAEGEETPSGPIYVPPKPPQTAQMVPYTNRAPTYPGSQDYPVEAQPFHPRFAADDAEVRTQTIPPLGRRGYVRVIGAIVGLVVIAGGAYTWTRYQVGDPAEAPVPAPTAATATAPDQPPSPTTVPAPPAGTATPPAGTATPPAGTATTPAGTATPPAGTATPPAGTAAAPPAAPSPAAATPSSDPPVNEAPPPPRPAAAARVPEPARPAAAPAPLREPIRPHRHGARDERRRAPAAAESPESATPAPTEVPTGKPAAKKRSLVDDDPDATLPPSSAE